MAVGDLKSQTALGFLTVLEHENLGYVGGYLVLNASGRPLEFHCTAPIKPNRSQQILFGPTLDSYLFGEQIGQTLVTTGSVEPFVICTDVARALSVSEFVTPPVALVLPSADRPAPHRAMASVWRVDAPHSMSECVAPTTVGRNQIVLRSGLDADRQALLASLESLGEFDLNEPFERIREAVEEAHKGARGC